MRCDSFSPCAARGISNERVQRGDLAWRDEVGGPLGWLKSGSRAPDWVWMTLSGLGWRRGGEPGWVAAQAGGSK